MVFAEAVILLISAILTYFLYQRSWRYKGQKLPPGPIRWPIVGSLPQMHLINKEGYLFKQLAGLEATYGDIMSIGLGTIYTVVISNFEMAKDLLKRPEFTMERYKFLFTEQRTNGKNLGLGWSTGETWTEVRRFTVKKLHEFGFGKATSSEITIREEMDSLMRDFGVECENNGGFWRMDTTRLSIVAINVLWDLVAGYKFDPTNDFIRRQIEVNHQIFEEILRPTNLLSVMPFLKIFPEWSGYRRQGEIHKTCWKVMEDLVNDAKMKRQSKIGQEADTFIEAFLDEIEKERLNVKPVLTEDQLVTVLMDLFLAGTDTTSIAMVWLIFYFARFPKVQNRARSEIFAMSDQGTKQILLKAAKRLPYVVACIWESMRHSPFGPTPPQRQTTTDVAYGDYIIPKGTCIIYDVYAYHHDPEYWGDPDVFRPERLLDSSGTKLDTDKLEHIPQFGFGRRICPGESMAMDVLFGFVTSLLTTYIVQVVPGNEPTDDLCPPSLTLTPKPYVVKFIPIKH